MTHDPLCSTPQLIFDSFSKKNYCICGTLAIARHEARQQAIHDCTAAVESVHSPIQYGENTYCRGCADAAYEEFSFTWPCRVVTSVRSLQETP
jgi:hypothetical protein